MELGYLGPIGSFSYMGASYYAPEDVLVAKNTFREIIKAVEEGNLEKGILPIENSTEGVVTQVVDGLMDTDTIKIQGELILKIHHHLLSVGKEVEELLYVLSHPQALHQCREYFAKNYPNITLLPCESTSQACEIAREKGKEYGAIANSWCAEKKGLRVIRSNIQDNLHNQTRFIIIGRKETMVTGKDKTSIAFSFHEDYPGNLYRVLKEFAEERVNLTRIESRPAKTELGKYIFYIDFHGHQRDIKSIKVLNNIEKITNKLKIFGSYPVGEIV